MHHNAGFDVIISDIFCNHALYIQFKFVVFLKLWGEFGTAVVGPASRPK